MYNENELFHSDVYLGNDYSDGITHFKYIRRYKVGDKWRYVYADKKTHKGISNDIKKYRKKSTDWVRNEASADKIMKTKIEVNKTRKDGENSVRNYAKQHGENEDAIVNAYRKEVNGKFNSMQTDLTKQYDKYRSAGEKSRREALNNINSAFKSIDSHDAVKLTKKKIEKGKAYVQQLLKKVK